MSALRTGHDAEQDVLRGYTLEAAKDEAARLALRADVITAHLRFYHYAEASVVKANLEAERNSLEMESADWSARIAEFTGQVTRVRELPVPLSPRARRQRREAV